MNRIILTLVMVFSFFTLFGQTNNFKSVGVDEFETLIAESDVVVLDVRTAAEHAEGFIAGTHYNIDVLEESFIDVAIERLPKDKIIALYCRSGNRSKSAARILTESGYQVVELGTGFRGWQTAGKRVAIP